VTANQLVSVSDAAKRLCISRRSLERRIAEGRIKRVKIGRRTLISLDELERFIHCQTEVVR
jgi:excisionase family DNA binding protein